MTFLMTNTGHKNRFEFGKVYKCVSSYSLLPRTKIYDERLTERQDKEKEDS